MPHQRFDPLAALRTAGAPEFDVFVHGTVFLDIIFAGMSAPTPGTEVWAEGMASCPGGIANLAVAARRLGLRTSLAAAFSDDDYGDFCWRTLEEQEGIDLGHSRRFPDWHSPVTVSMSYGGDRSMVSHGHDAPIPTDRLIGRPPCARAVFVDPSDVARVSGDGSSWIDLARGDGALCFADVGWDPKQEWSSAVLDQLEHCHAFMPNALEAMAYTGTSSVPDALYRIADRVPLAVVTNGAEGAVGIDGTTGEEANVPALRVEGLDPTGSGDVFAAAMVLGTLSGWALADRMAFASLCSALALQQFGGSLAAPGWGDVVDWWHALLVDRSADSYHRSLRRRYAFLEEIAPHVPVTACRRATATIARRADLPS
ncbi:MAG: PfkB family carbohydrate kinase [Intrasporangium sp.]|uniref:carbohydrate kinase family protein n=1 Tax=Intrasporangium sp. TaxID=1925024 RepID=UPI002647C69C|nr:PfkB family carbohydrate kinase [Intrasporangium sp.]MDN5796004.1 PfkB family carbohydrate kinase [Intrasporangium sp.]